MTTAPSGVQRYAARYFDASPTWFRWNKLSAADVYKLREEPGFRGQNVWFWLNHPIQFVRIVGFVCQVDQVAGGKYILMTVDDGSGANIEVKLERPVAYREQNGAVYSTKTNLDNVEVMSHFGLPVVIAGKARVDMGTVIIAEGKVESYNQSRQIIALRLGLVKDTNEETIHWSKVADWKRSVLNKPWVLSSDQRTVIDAKLIETEKVAEQQSRRRKKKNAKIEELRRRHEEKIEAKRKQRTEYYNQGALPGSHILKMPWDD
ncbi:hypothetical protein CBER1_09406 [Cercospora berteroae]|uniref:CST complex subunit STN1 n=1 Tax=Cercospora berteroae TaxID=357750 RepID=A0A2S6CE19_9PEZI|nr:hypothetical protein CBER1_09406 [Cercospora berteroae]